MRPRIKSDGYPEAKLGGNHEATNLQIFYDSYVHILNYEEQFPQLKPVIFLNSIVFPSQIYVH